MNGSLGKVCWVKQKASVFKPSLQPEINLVNCQLIALFFVTFILSILDLHDWSILVLKYLRMERGLNWGLQGGHWAWRGSQCSAAPSLRSRKDLLWLILYSCFLVILTWEAFAAPLASLLLRPRCRQWTGGRMPFSPLASSVDSIFMVIWTCRDQSKIN